jgi:hypothetical protein
MPIFIFDLEDDLLQPTHPLAWKVQRRHVPYSSSILFGVCRNNGNNRDLNRGFPDWADLGKPWSQLKQNRSIFIVVFVFGL